MKEPLPRDRDIKVGWQCGMGKDCTNKQEPGMHRGDTGYEEAQKCVHQHDPAALRKLRQH